MERDIQMSKSRIDYADWAWGVVDGCNAIREGCRNCYAKAMADRFWGERKFSEVRTHSERLEEVVKLKPQVVFVAPMGDLFHKNVPDEFIYRVFVLMAIKARQHSYIIFTKRPERMRDFMSLNHEFAQEHIWLGVSVSTQKDVDEFLPILCDTIAGKRIVSVEPFLSRVTFKNEWLSGMYQGELKHDALGTEYHEIKYGPRINGVFCGCESGTNARPQPPYIDIIHLRDQCFQNGVAFYLKQWRDNNFKISHKPFLDGRQWLEMPERKG